MWEGEGTERSPNVGGGGTQKSPQCGRGRVQKGHLMWEGVLRGHPNVGGVLRDHLGCPIWGALLSLGESISSCVIWILSPLREGSFQNLFAKPEQFPQLVAEKQV